ncbi:MAG TPA: glycosyl hydrolase, partial [Bacillota bacterium]|nr:glycosyl hydrolase [Bacillota bacterium]
TRCIREDPKQKGLLYAGTESAIYVSFDDGGHWEPLQLNLPRVPIHDIAIKNDELVAATHGRSFWILDDLTVLHQMTDAVRSAPAHLFTPKPTIRLTLGRGFRGDPENRRAFHSTGGFVASYKLVKDKHGDDRTVYLDAGENTPAGVVVHYLLKSRPEGEVKLAFLETNGTLIKEFTSQADDKAKKKGPKVAADAGMNRFVWDMRYPDAHEVPGAIFWSGGVTGPRAAPGAYQVRLTVNGQSYTQPFEIKRDPRIAATDADLKEQFQLLIEIRDRLSETHDAINNLRTVRGQLDEWVKRAEGRPMAKQLADAAEGIKAKLNAVEEELIQFRSKAHEDPLNFPIKLNNKLASLSGVVAAADTKPTAQAREVYSELSSKIIDQLANLREVVNADVAGFSRLVQQAELPAVVLKAD